VTCCRALCLLALLLTPAAAAAPSIFDDNWTPPKSERPAPPPPPKADPPKPQTPATPDVPPVVDPPAPAPAVAAVTPVARRPVPSPADQARVRALMREVYAAQLNDRTAPARRKLAESLMTQADRSAELPVEQFVLLAAAVNASAEAASLPLAFSAADRLAKSFDVDALALKAEAVRAPLPRPPTPEATLDNVRAALDLAEDLAAAEDYATALRVLAVVQPTAAADPALRAQLAERQRALTAVRDVAAKAAKDLDALRANPEDPAANLAVGRFYCFYRNDWPAGLPLLAKGADVPLRDLAARERTAAGVAERVAGVADEWWALAAKQPDPAAKAAITAHAVDLYRSALDGVAGLRRQLIEQRIATAGARPAAPGAPAQSSTVKVLATKPWQPFGQVKKGDVLAFAATGRWSNNNRPDSPPFGPEGKPRERPAYGHLEGRVGNGAPFTIGVAAKITAPSDGVLFLQMDDTKHDDNTGELTVTITRAPAHPAVAATPAVAKPGGRVAARQEIVAAGNNGVIIAVNGHRVMVANREKPTSAPVELKEGDLISVKLPDRYDINSVWLACVTPDGQPLFETSEAWTSYIPKDKGDWTKLDAKTEKAPAKFCADRQEYVDRVKKAAAQTKVYRGAQPIRSELTDGTRIAYLNYIVTRADLIPK